jgi:ubiquinone/menaquinone biosynthesis C-methylase UbiE
MLKAYIAQAVEGRDPLDILNVLKWQTDLLKGYGFEPVVPYINSGQSVGSSSDIVFKQIAEDLSLLWHVDLLFADVSLMNHEYVGTLMELAYARILRIPSVVYVGKSPLGNRKWLNHHSDLLFTSRESLEQFFSFVPTFNAIKDLLPAYYDERALTYDDAYEMFGRHSDPKTNRIWKTELQSIEEQMMPFITGRVLDVACGSGWWALKMPQDCLLTLLDESSSMLDIAANKMQSSGKKYNLVKADALARLPFPDNYFDSCFFAFWIGLLNPFVVKSFLNEISRVVIPEGSILLFDSKRERFGGDYECACYDIQYRGANRIPFFKKYYTCGDLRKLLSPFATQLECLETETYFVGAKYQNRKSCQLLLG